MRSIGNVNKNAKDNKNEKRKIKEFGQNELNFPAYNLIYFVFLSLNIFFLFSTFSLLMTLRRIANTGDGHLMCKRY